MFIATVQMLCMAFIYRNIVKLLDEYFCFVAGTDYMSWCHNGIRQFLAIAIIMAGFPLLLKRKYIPLIAIILLGATFHASALLMIRSFLLCRERHGIKRVCCAFWDVF